MNKVKYGKHTYELPSTWDELSKQQFTDIAAVLLYYYSKLQHTVEEWRALREECLIILFGFKRGIFRHSKKAIAIQRMDANSRISLMHHEEILPWIFSKVSMSKHIIKDFRIGITTYYAPYINLTDVTATEFIEAHIYSQLYEMNKDPKYLAELIALLYRPMDGEYKKRSSLESVADMRVRNDSFSHEERTALFLVKLPLQTKMAVYLQYCSHLENFTRQYTHFFKKVKKTIEEEKDVPDLPGYLVLVKNHSGGKFGNYDETKLQRADLFFDEVENSILRYDEQIRLNKQK
jgi:hypothetical protein